jgi:hypothetical protein
MFVGNVSNEEANSNSLCSCPSLIQERSSSSRRPRISNSSRSRSVVASRPCKRRRLSADNELDRDLGAAFAQMEMIRAGEAMTRADRAFTGADGVSTGPDGVLTGADGVLIGPDGVLIEADGVFTGPDRVLTGADGVADELDGVLTGADGVFTGVLTGLDMVMARPDGVEIRGVILISAQDQSKLLADVAAYKARISFLESKLAELGFKEDASNDDSVVWAEELFEDRVVEQPENQAEDQAPMPTAPVFPLNEADQKGKRQMTDLELWRFEERLDPQTTLQEQLDSTLDWMNLADHFATALAFENQALANKMDELRQQL